MKHIMKKITTLLSLFLLALLIVSCSGTKIDDIYEQINVGNRVSENFELPKKIEEATLVWSSDNDEVISIIDYSDTSYLAEITPKLNEQTVSISVNIVLADESESFSFDVTVLAVDEILHEVSLISTFGTEELSIVDQSKIDFSSMRKEGYAYIGVFYDKDYTDSFDVDTKITNDIVLYLYYELIPEDNQEVVDLDTQLLTEYYQPTVENYQLELITRSYAGSNVLWTSSNLNVITNAGFVLGASEDTYVTMTATVKGKRGTTSQTIDFEVFVPAYDNELGEIETSVDLPYTNMTEEYEVADNSLTTYYFENSDIPYVNVESFLEVLDGFVDFKEIEFVYEEQQLTISYIYVYEDTDEEGNPIDVSETYSAVLDLEENTLTVESLDFFDGYIQSTATDFSEGISYQDDVYYEEGLPVVFDFDAYRISSTIYENGDSTEFLLPFHIVNLIFTGGAYYNVYYNGDGYQGIYYVPDDTDLETIKTSSLNETVPSNEMLRFNYDTMALVLNVYYGLKNDRQIEDYYTVLQEYQGYLLNTNAESISSGFFNLVNKTLDDLHTSVSFLNIYNEPSFDIPLTSVSQLGPNVSAWYNVLFDVQDTLETAYPDTNIPPDFRFLDEEKTTAVIYLDGFVTASVDETKSKDNDSDAYMNYVLTSIYRESPNVENIAIDLSYNTGGNIGALLRVLGYMTEQSIQMSYQNPTEQSYLTYFIDLDQEAYDDVNWFILTSKVTFSAANLMTAIAKNQGFATILGTTSGGGASSIIPVVFPNGSMFTMSSLSVLSVRSLNEDETYTYTSIEHGVEPDYELLVSQLANDQYILELIQSINN